MNRPPLSLNPVTVSRLTSFAPFGEPRVVTSVIASPTSRIIIGGGVDPSGVTRRPETRIAGPGRRLIVRSVRSSPAFTVTGVAAPAVDAAG